MSQFRGEAPVYFLKMREKYAESVKPESSESSFTVNFDETLRLSSIAFALSIRTNARYSVGGIPMVFLKSEAKYTLENGTLSYIIFTSNSGFA